MQGETTQTEQTTALLLNMHSDGLVAISKRKIPLTDLSFRPPTWLTIFLEVADLDINDGPSNPAAFAGFEEAPPPAPKLHNKGVVAMDITEQFTDAARRTF
jgi:hypothetical protein